MSDTIGWVIVHPDGRHEMDYFHIKKFRSKLDNYKAEISAEEWKNLYRPDCQIKKMKVVDL